MEISYRREMNHNYLMLKEEGMDEHGYAAKMMISNPIEGLLRFRIKKTDAQSLFCYEITSRQPLSRLLEHRSITAEEIRQLLLEIAGTINRMEAFLLKEEEILLQSEFIYIEPDSFQVSLCLIPGCKADFPNDLSKLLEYLLGKVDYQDKDGVVMAYALYRESLKENYGMDDLLKLLFLKEEKQEKRNENKEDEKPELEKAEQKKPEQKKPEQEKEEQKKVYRKSGEGVQREAKEKRMPGILERLFLLFGIRKKESEQKTSSIKKQESWQMFFDDELEAVGVQPQILEKREPISEAEETQTTLLFDADQKKIKHRLMSLDPEISDIQIAYYPFLIGKQENLVDYVLDKDTVSRLHLRIDEEEGQYRITDLNSTNGIRIAGRLMETNETTEIRGGEEIEIANFHFRFV